MLKIYNAYNEHGIIKIEDYIDFIDGQFDTGINGFGKIESANLSCKRANYELQNLKYYMDYLKRIKIIDGYVKDFSLWNPISYKMLEEKYKAITKDFETYEKYGLNEEGILLFTNWICLTYPSDGSVKRIFGRYPETGMYLIMPNASFGMTTNITSDDVQENYEVLQSQTLGKQLILTKMNRKI